MRAAKGQRSERERPRRTSTDQEEDRGVARKRAEAAPLPEDFVLRQSPWVDFTLTSFFMGERVSNFLNLGVQFGGYVVDRMRLSARLVVPLEQVDDDYSVYNGISPQVAGGGFFQPVDSPNMSVLYSGSVGIILSNTKTFVFAPGVLVQRTDVNDYGTSIGLQLPFEWTTQRHLRVGFELSIGHAFGGTVTRSCYVSSSVSCGQDEIDRPGATTILVQYGMGWSLGHL